MLTYPIWEWVCACVCACVCAGLSADLSEASVDHRADGVCLSVAQHAPHIHPTASHDSHIASCRTCRSRHHRPPHPVSAQTPLNDRLPATQVSRPPWRTDWRATHMAWMTVGGCLSGGGCVCVRQSSDVADDVVDEVVSAGDKATGLWLTTGAVGVLVLGLWQQAARYVRGDHTLATTASQSRLTIIHLVRSFSARRRERSRIRRALDEYADAQESWIREGIDPEAEEYLRQQGYRRPQYQAYTQSKRQQTDTDK